MIMFNQTCYRDSDCENYEPVQMLPAHTNGGLNNDPFHPGLKSYEPMTMHPKMRLMGSYQYPGRTMDQVSNNQPRRQPSFVPSGLPSLLDYMNKSFRAQNDSTTNKEDESSNDKTYQSCAARFDDGCFQQQQQCVKIESPTVQQPLERETHLEKKLTSPKKWLLNKYRQSTSSSDSSAESSPKEYEEDAQQPPQNNVNEAAAKPVSKRDRSYFEQEGGYEQEADAEDDEDNCLRINKKRRKIEKEASLSPQHSSSSEYPSIMGSGPNTPTQDSTDNVPTIVSYPHYYDQTYQQPQQQQQQPRQMWSSVPMFNNQMYQQQQQQSWNQCNMCHVQQRMNQQNENVVAANKKKTVAPKPQPQVKAQQSQVVPSDDTISGKVLDNSSKGTTCHQCKQKTTDKKSCCCLCSAKGGSVIRGSFCASCLSNRYGEDLEEVLKNPQWICPICRGECNCSSCRRKLQKTPISVTTREALKKGFTNVRDYLTSIGSM